MMAIRSDVNGANDEFFGFENSMDISQRITIDFGAEYRFDGITHRLAIWHAELLVRIYSGSLSGIRSKVV
jgi:hypothetical protein